MNASLPQCVRQHWVLANGSRYRLDFAWPDERVAVECNGWEFHGRERFDHDGERSADLASAGWRVIPVTWKHTSDPSSVVRACATLVKPGGWVFFSTINRNPKSFLFAIVGAEHVLKLLPKGTHEYARFIRPSELTRWSRDAGLDATATRGLEYNPITRRYWLSADTSVNYMIACRKTA